MMASGVRLIDANALVEKLIDNGWLKLDITDSVEMVAVEATIEEATTIDPESLRPMGRWENYPSHLYRRCSVCKVEWEKQRFNIRANYCPNCGAKMEG